MYSCCFEAETVIGSLRERQELKRAVRAGFWTIVERASSDLPEE